MTPLVPFLRCCGPLPPRRVVCNQRRLLLEASVRRSIIRAVSASAFRGWRDLGAGYWANWSWFPCRRRWGRATGRPANDRLSRLDSRVRQTPANCRSGASSRGPRTRSHRGLRNSAAPMAAVRLAGQSVVVRSEAITATGVAVSRRGLYSKPGVTPRIRPSRGFSSAARGEFTYP